MGLGSLDPFSVVQPVASRYTDSAKFCMPISKINLPQASGQRTFQSPNHPLVLNIPTAVALSCSGSTVLDRSNMGIVCSKPALVDNGRISVFFYALLRDRGCTTA
jgi:hypothetical protein